MCILNVKKSTLLSMTAQYTSVHNFSLGCFVALMAFDRGSSTMRLSLCRFSLSLYFLLNWYRHLMWEHFVLSKWYFHTEYHISLFLNFLGGVGEVLSMTAQFNWNLSINNFDYIVAYKKAINSVLPPLIICLCDVREIDPQFEDA